jgi:NAD(P)-dependent dehydrogenase (short-subunit alcohol dehydrogenase family)
MSVKMIVGSSGIIGTPLVEILERDGSLIFVDKAVLNSDDKNSYNCDCSVDKEVKGLFESLSKNNVVCDEIYINAGGAAVSYEEYISNIEDLDISAWHKIVQGNMDIVFLVVKYGLKTGVFKKRSSITITSTIHSIVGPRFDTYRDCYYNDFQMNSSIGYSAAKSGVNGMVKYLCSYLSDRKIRVNAILPGGVYSGQQDKFVSQYSEHVPLGRMAEAKEIAEVIASVGGRLSYVNGQLIVVDGGKSSW